MEKCCCEKNRQKRMPRDFKEKKDLENRINRIQGQLLGIKKMIQEDRYCGDILIQVSAVEKALEKAALIILKTHMKTCVKEDLLEGNNNVIDETISLIERLQ